MQNTYASGLDKIEVRIKDISENQYWNESTFIDPIPNAEIWNLADGTTNWYYKDVPPWNNKEYEVNIRAQDISGKISVIYSTAAFTFDSQMPVSVTTSPANGSGVNSLQTISGTAHDDNGISLVKIRVHRTADNDYWDGSGWSASSDNWRNASGTGSGTVYWSYTCARSKTVLRVMPGQAVKHMKLFRRREIMHITKKRLCQQALSCLIMLRREVL